MGHEHSCMANSEIERAPPEGRKFESNTSKTLGALTGPQKFRENTTPYGHTVLQKSATARHIKASFPKQRNKTILLDRAALCCQERDVAEGPTSKDLGCFSNTTDKLISGSAEAATELKTLSFSFHTWERSLLSWAAISFEEQRAKSVHQQPTAPLSSHSPPSSVL